MQIEIWAQEFPFLSTVFLCVVMGIFAGATGTLLQLLADSLMARFKRAT